LGYVKSEDTGEYLGDNSETMKDVESISRSSSDHDCNSFPNGNENSKERGKPRYKKYLYSKAHLDYKKISNGK